MPAGSPAVDRSAKPEDPIAKATTLAQEEARFRTDEKRFQQESTAMPAGSPQVNPHERAADPLRKATTRAQKAAAFAAEEHFFQQRSTPWNGSARRV